MNGLTYHVADYLRRRRTIGFQLTHPGHVLRQFASWLHDQCLKSITVGAALEWVRLSNGQTISLAHRLTAIREFARYMRTIDPGTQVPPTGIFDKQRSPTVPIFIPRLKSASFWMRPAACDPGCMPPRSRH